MTDLRGCVTKRTSGLRLHRLLLFVAVVAVVALVACQQDERATESVSGTVVEVTSSSLVELEELSVTDDSGKTWVFVSRGYGGFSPSHLDEHRVQGSPVTVSFYVDGDERVIETITD